MKVLVRVLFVVAAVLLLSVGWSGMPRVDGLSGPAIVRATPVVLPARTGRLRLLGAVRLDSPARNFGGFSGIAVAGRRITLIDDGGGIVEFDVDARLQPSRARFANLPAGPRTGWEKRDRDSESIARGPDGRLWVGFESVNAIWRYAPGFARAERVARPLAMRDWESNGGPESLALLPGGGFVTISESSRWKEAPGRAAIRFLTDPTLAPRRGFRFSYRPAPGFDPSDAAALPNGDLLVLERRFETPFHFTMRLVRVSARTIRPRATVRGTLVAQFDRPGENLEGIAITREGRHIIVWLVSDNDQSWWRPSYLLKYRLD